VGGWGGGGWARSPLTGGLQYKLKNEIGIASNHRRNIKSLLKI